MADASSDGSGPVRAAVLGLARSGLGAAALLMDRGCRVTLLDLRMPPASRAAVEALEARGARARIGPHDPEWLAGFDLLVTSPGIPADAPYLLEAGARGVPVISELELACTAAEGPIVAITGTNGKSTTTAWTGHMLAESGVPTEVVGNIGRPFSEGVRKNPRAVFVCEVSSFQLEHVRTFRPKVGVLLNLTPDHLDRHGTIEVYLDTKLRLFDRQAPEDLAIVGPDDALDRAVRARARGRIGRAAPRDLGGEGAFVRDGKVCVRLEGLEVPLADAAALSLPGPHNLENALSAAAAAMAAGADSVAVERSLRTFPGLLHRLETVGTVGGVRFVNDSKATNTDSLAVALRSFAGPVTLIAGGKGKGQDFRPLAPLIRERVGLLLLIGEASVELAEAWQGVPTVRTDSLEEAVAEARRRTPAGGIALLSPGCASFDMFSSYEERGDRFRQAVRALEGRDR